MLSGVSKTIVSLMIIGMLGGPVFAVQDTLDTQRTRAIGDLQTLYQKWKTGNTGNSLEFYIQRLQASDAYIGAINNRFTGQIELNKLILPSGAWIIGYYQPKDPASKGFYIDLNGVELPNDNHSGSQADQIQIELDPSGQTK